MRRHPIFAVGLVILALAVALPALAADPTPSSGPSASAGTGKGDKTKAPKAPKIEVTLKGSVATTTDAAGKTTYTIQSGGKIWTLHAGPAWFFGDKYPLKPFVGKSVTIVGETREGSTDVGVLSIDGTALRAPGKPPWAGGWKHVGKLHPGWTQEKADRFKARFGDCFPPGQCKVKPGHDKSGQSARPGAGPEASEAPEGSEAPDADESPAP